jgi:ribonuclease HI
MECRALIAAMEHAGGQPCEIFTDSEFWIKTITEWSLKWEANGWQKKGGIKNLDLVKEVCALYKNSKAKLTWVRAHVGTDGNELADQWANRARQEKLVK